MTYIGYHCSHECFAPSTLLRWVRLAEEAGFAAAMCSDHFHPWSETQGQSGFAWSWLGAALQATSLSFGTVCAPGQRYHPAIVAQAAATLAEMYPGRLWCALGSGEYLNEHITGEEWPPKPERNQRLLEAVQVIRALWAGEMVTHYGRFTVQEAKLYTRPAEPPLILGAALTAETAEWVGGWADGIITVAKPRADQEKFIQAFRRGGHGKPMYLQVLLSYAQDEQTARREAWQNWRTNVIGGKIAANLKMPAHFDEAAQFVREDDVAERLRVSADLDRHIAWLREDIELGFERIYLYHAGSDQETFIKTFGARVLPRLVSAR